MKTINEITGNKSFGQLAIAEREELQARQNWLAVAWKNEPNELIQRELFDELHESFKTLIKSMARRQAEKFFMTEQEEVEGILYEVLANCLYDYNESRDFHGFYVTYAGYAIGKMYRKDGKDAIDTTYKKENRLDASVGNEDGAKAMAEKIESKEETMSEAEVRVTANKLVNECFEDGDKKAAVLMFIDGFKREEIIKAVNTEGKKHDTVARMVNRAIKQFQNYCLNLPNLNLA
ncbi:TPA: sigma-70 family RNA polymerase sigma factor [Bacillus cereus]|nr:sigma-70 family RNA polymerase sigma factor [Bacillus cereus]